MQICEYFFENACYSVTKYYLCKQNNKRSLLGRKQQSQVARSFPNRYLFSYTNKVTSLFSISCILDIILSCNMAETRKASSLVLNTAVYFTATFLPSMIYIPGATRLSFSFTPPRLYMARTWSEAVSKGFVMAVAGLSFSAL